MAAAGGGERGVVVVDGMAGAGKTALAVHAAHLLADRFPDGRLFIDLHAHTAGQVPVTAADALARLLSAIGVPAPNIPTGPDVAAVTEQRAALWRARLAGRRMLVVLDNAASSDQISPLLPGSAGCLVLVTTRRRLARLPATQVELGMLPETEAAELFIRAAGRRIEAGVQQPALAQLMELCGFLPLAVTLLAGRLRQHPAWSITELVGRMRQTQDRLTELRAEHRAVAAAFALSYQNLPVQRQEFFRRIGVHPGPEFDAYATAALHGIPVARARALLEDLYDEHLLIEGAAGRYRMHDLVGEYARGLPAAPLAEVEHALARLFNFYQHTTTCAGRHLRLQPRTGPDLGVLTEGPALDSRAEAITWLNAERTNLLTCLGYATEHDLPVRVVGLTAAMADYLRLTGPWDLAIALHHTAANNAHRGGDRLGEANALNDLGIVQRLTGDYKAAADSLRQALTLYRDLADRLGEANTLNDLGMVQRLTGDYKAAADSLRQALTLYRDLADRLGEANTLNDLGMVQRLTGDYKAAADSLRQALTLYRDLADRLGEANTLNYLGAVQRLTGDYQAATGSLRQALTLYCHLSSRLGEANALNQVGAVQRLTGDYEAATGSLRQALTLFRDLGDLGGEAEVLNNLGTLNLALNEPGQAADNYRHALTLARDIHSRLQQARALEGLGRHALSLGHLHEAKTNLRQAASLYQGMGAAADTDRVTTDLARLDTRLKGQKQADQPP